MKGVERAVRVHVSAVPAGHDVGATVSRRSLYRPERGSSASAVGDLSEDGDGESDSHQQMFSKASIPPATYVDGFVTQICRQLRAVEIQPAAQIDRGVLCMVHPSPAIQASGLLWTEFTFRQEDSTVP